MPDIEDITNFREMYESTSSQSGGEIERKIYVKLIEWENVQADYTLLTCHQEDLCHLISCVGIQELTKYDSSIKSTCEIHDRDLSPQPLLQNLSVSINQFLVWSDTFVKSIDKPNNQLAWHCDQLTACCNSCKEVYSLIQLANNTLRMLRNKCEFTSNKTISLNQASKKIVQSQTNLMQINNDILNNIRYFVQIEQLAWRLRSTAPAPLNGKIGECLTSIDENLLFLQKNENFKDASVYIARYKHMLSKVINIIRNHVSFIIKNAAQETLNTGQDEIPDQDTAFTLYYGKFHNSALKVRQISKLVEDRVKRDAGYEDLLAEMHKVYFTERANVLKPVIEKSIAELKNNNKGDYCVLTRSVCGLLAHVCQDEHRLFFLFFSSRTIQLFSYLEDLCLILYDALRPYLIHINHLETLAEICGIIKIEMLEENLQLEGGALEPFVSVMRQLLQDTQERLVFRTHIYINSDILNYNPSPGDLAYPEKLQMMENIAATFPECKNSAFSTKTSELSISSSAGENVKHNIEGRRSLQLPNSPADLLGMWYPTVRRTIICLSRLYRCVDRIVFQGLSQEAVRCCIQNIDKAAAEISQKQSIMDGQLFQIKHLLILREQMAPFRAEFTMKETSLDFSKMKTAAFDLLQNRKQLFSLSSNNALLEFLFDGAPQVKEHFMDSRKELDKHLKLICEQFIQWTVNKFVGSLISFLNKAESFLSDASHKHKLDSDNMSGNISLSRHPWASSKYLKDAICSCEREIKSDLAGLQRSMKLYLSNRDTEFIIFRLIRNNIINTFTKLENLLLNQGYTAEELIIIDCPSAEQVSVLISSVSILSESVERETS